MIEAKSESSANLARIDGNLGYAFNKYLNLKGGVNVSKFTTGSGVQDLNAGLGLQANLGFQFNENIGLDVGYSESNVSGKVAVTSMGSKIDMAETSIKLSGLEVALTATF